MCPNDNVGALSGLRSNRETICNLFRRLDLDLDPIVVFEILNNRRKGMPSVAIHPDQKLSIGPGEKVRRDQEQRRLHSLPQPH